MPTVRYNPEVQSTPRSPSTPGMVGEVIGKTAEKLTDSLINVTQHIQKTKEDSLYLQLQTGVFKEEKNFTEQMYTRDDPENFVQDYNKIGQNIKESELYINAPDRVKIKFGAWHAQHTLGKTATVSKFAREGVINQSRIALFDSLNTHIEGLDSLDSAEVERASQAFNESIETGKELGLFTDAKEVFEFQAAFDSKMRVNQVKYDLLMYESAEDALKILNDPKNFTNLTDGERKGLKAIFNDRWDFEKKEQEQRKFNAQYNSLKLLVDGKLTETMILENGDLEAFGEGSQNTFLSLLRQIREQGNKDPYDVTNFGVYLDLMEGLSDQTTDADDILKAMSASRGEGVHPQLGVKLLDIYANRGKEDPEVTKVRSIIDGFGRGFQFSKDANENFYLTGQTHAKFNDWLSKPENKDKNPYDFFKQPEEPGLFEWVLRMGSGLYDFTEFTVDYNIRKVKDFLDGEIDE